MKTRDYTKKHRVYFLVSNSHHQVSTVEWWALVTKTGTNAEPVWHIDQELEWARAMQHYAALGRDLSLHDVIVTQFAPDIPAKDKRNTIIWLENQPYVDPMTKARDEALAAMARARLEAMKLLGTDAKTEAVADLAQAADDALMNIIEGKS